MDKKCKSLSLVAALKACAHKKDLYQISRIHVEVRKSGLLSQNGTYLGNTLVSSYAKCGALTEAQQVLDELPIRNIVSWNALIAGFSRDGCGKEALGCFHQMQVEGLSPNAITYVCTLKACGISQDINMGEKIHDEIVRQGLLEKQLILGGALIDMYAKCGVLTKAQKVSDDLPVRNVISWSALIAGYCLHYYGTEALASFHKMRYEGFSPDAITYASTLKACGILQDSEMGERFLEEIVSRRLLEKHVFLGSALVDMYAKCGILTKAQKILDELFVRDVASWNALIAGYAQHGNGKEALGCFHRMRSEGVSPNAVTYTCTAMACGIMQDVGMGERIHNESASQGLLKKHVLLGGALVDMYAKCGALTKAQKVFDQLPVKSVVSWSTLITGYAQHDYAKEALGCFQRMRSEGLSPDAITYASTLKACGIVLELGKGEGIHKEITNQGLLHKHAFLGGALVDMYAKCGALTKAQKVLDELPVRNVVSWSAMIAGYVQNECGKEALSCFQHMLSEGLSPDAVTYACVLKACSVMQDVVMGDRFHNEIASQRLLEKHVLLGGALVSMYAKCGALTKAQEVLDELYVRNVVSWNALITGYAEHSCGNKALGCFQQMQIEGLAPDAVTYVCALKACGITEDLDMGERIHEEIASHGLLEKDVLLGGALVDMYAKCGNPNKAQKVLDELPVRDVITWSTLIAGYAQKGQGKEALDCFKGMRSEGFFPDEGAWNVLIGGYAQQGLVEEALGCFRQMQQEGTSPTAITFVNVLNACSHAGLVDEGQMFFESMKESFGIIPDQEHYACMVDLFGRARHFEKAMKVIKLMPASDGLLVWCSLLGACGKEGNVELGRLAFECAVEVDECQAAAYVLMSNINAAAGMQ